MVDDNSTNQQLASLYVARLGHMADVVNNGLEAIELLIKVPYDLILMDVEMPVVDGI